MVGQDWKFKQELSIFPSFMLNIPLILASLFMWIANLNFSVGLMNLFPLWITDGGKIALEIIDSVIKNKRTALFISNYLFLFCLSLLLFNLIGPYIISAFNLIAPYVINAFNSIIL
jgi:membrane-associated protease RseP (regulator of RpoE activity)